MSGNPVLPRDARTVDRFFDASVFSSARAGPAGYRHGRRDAGARTRQYAAGFARGPGITNTDLALFKNFKIAERVKTQLRFEAYNVFNHTQFTSVTARWNQSGVQDNATFGRLTSARDPRILQVAIRLHF